MQLFLAFGFGTLKSIELDIRFINTELTLRVSLRAFEPNPCEIWGLWSARLKFIVPTRKNHMGMWHGLMFNKSTRTLTYTHDMFGYP